MSKEPTSLKPKPTITELGESQNLKSLKDMARDREIVIRFFELLSTLNSSRIYDKETNSPEDISLVREFRNTIDSLKDDIFENSELLNDIEILTKYLLDRSSSSKPELPSLSVLKNVDPVVEWYTSGEDTLKVKIEEVKLNYFIYFALVGAITGIASENDIQVAENALSNLKEKYGSESENYFELDGLFGIFSDPSVSEDTKRKLDTEIKRIYDAIILKWDSNQVIEPSAFQKFRFEGLSGDQILLFNSFILSYILNFLEYKYYEYLSKKDPRSNTADDEKGNLATQERSLSIISIYYLDRGLRIFEEQRKQNARRDLIQLLSNLSFIPFDDIPDNRNLIDQLSDSIKKADGGEVSKFLSIITLILVDSRLLGALNEGIATFSTEYSPKLLESDVDFFAGTYKDNIKSSFLILSSNLLGESTGSYIGSSVIEKVKKLKVLLKDLIDRIEDNIALNTSVNIRNKFVNYPPEFIFPLIEFLPQKTSFQSSLRSDLLDTYGEYLSKTNKSLFERFKKLGKFPSQKPEIERRLPNDSFDYVRGRFVASIYPLVECLRSDPRSRPRIQKFLSTSGVDKKPRNRYELRLSALEKQRGGGLDPIERSYLETVALNSLFTPYLVACANSEPEITRAYLRHHFKTLTEKTKAKLKDGDYFPLLQIGLGPNGLTALGEIVRINPNLAKSTLIVDSGSQPGGPFAVPDGPAWKLNSANPRGANTRTLSQDFVPLPPSSPASVRSYGSPLRFYPGERNSDQEGQLEPIRRGDINTSVDWSILPSDISDARYANNQDLQTVLALQTATVANNLALETKVVSIEKNPNPNSKGDKLVTLEIKEPNGIRIVKVTTDAVICATGLGEPTYGFPIKPGSVEERIINSSKKAKGFPKISTTLEAFNAISAETGERYFPGKRIAIWGIGNSAETLTELLGGLFDKGPDFVNSIEKIYIIAEGSISDRPRYASLRDLLSRGINPNLVEIVDGRVTGVDYSLESSLSKSLDPQEKKLRLYNGNNPILDNSGEVIIVDSGIAATGFKPTIGKILQDYTQSQNQFRSMTLPSNEEVPVGQALIDDPNVLVLGVAFQQKNFNEETLAQLPRPSRQALEKISKNLVAIGFIAPQTQAAVNVWLSSSNVNLENQGNIENVIDRNSIMLNSEREVNQGGVQWFGVSVDPQNLGIPSSIRDSSRVLAPIFIHNIGNAIRLQKLKGNDVINFNGKLEFGIRYFPDSNEFEIQNNSDIPVSQELLDAVINAFSETDCQSYAISSFNQKRKSREFEIELHFLNGYIDPRHTTIEI